ncbi:MAG: hypothetical protein OES46_04520 [Gammaproteobacteria bacterium]|nr:hypothetical protein [Gammaproteobacteria bacterium]
MPLLRFPILVILLVSSAPAFARQVRIDIETALALADKKEYVSAVGILAPCLKATSPTKYSNLEDCLFHGDKITEKAVRPLASRYEKETNYGRTGVQFQNWPGVARYLEMGLDPRLGYYGGTIYEHEFLRHLRDLFPNSKYRDVYEYKLLERGENDMASGQQWVDALKSYRSQYPNGRYFINATSDLANAYDDLWEILRPNSQHEHHEYFSVGDQETDTQRSEQYRALALDLYEELTRYDQAPDPYQLSLLQDARQRHKTLNDRKPSHSFYILND